MDFFCQCFDYGTGTMWYSKMEYPQNQIGSIHVIIEFIWVCLKMEYCTPKIQCAITIVSFIKMAHWKPLGVSCDLTSAIADVHEVPIVQRYHNHDHDRLYPRCRRGRGRCHCCCCCCCRLYHVDFISCLSTMLIVQLAGTATTTI